MNSNYNINIRYDEKLLASVRDISQQVKRKKKRIMNEIKRQTEKTFKENRNGL